MPALPEANGRVATNAPLLAAILARAGARIVFCEFVGARPTDAASGRAIVRRARSRLGEQRYHLLENNCEHFCNWCITGFSHSVQAQRPIARLIQALTDALGFWSRVAAMTAPA